MPLRKSASPAAVGPNIVEMRRGGYPEDQAIAAALDTQRRAKRKQKPKAKRKSRARKGEFDYMNRKAY